MGKNTIAGSISALIVFTVASVTDFLDGYLARKYGLISMFGKIMDPIADKFLVLSAFFIFTQMQIMGLWAFVVIAAREVIITGLRLLAMRSGAALAAEGAGKLKTVLQIALIYLIMFAVILAQWIMDGNLHQEIMEILFQAINLFIWVVVAVTLWSGISFLIKNRKEAFHVG